MVLPNIREILVEIGFSTLGDKKARRDIQKLERELNDIETSIAKVGRRGNVTKDEIGGLRDQFTDLRKEFQRADTDINDSGEALDDFNRKLHRVRRSAKGLQDEGAGEWDVYTLQSAIDGLREDLYKTAPATHTASEGIDEVGDEAAESTAEVSALAASLTGLGTVMQGGRFSRGIGNLQGGFLASTASKQAFGEPIDLQNIQRVLDRAYGSGPLRSTEAVRKELGTSSSPVRKAVHDLFESETFEARDFVETIFPEEGSSFRKVDVVREALDKATIGGTRQTRAVTGGRVGSAGFFQHVQMMDEVLGGMSSPEDLTKSNVTNKIKEIFTRDLGLIDETPEGMYRNWGRVFGEANTPAQPVRQFFNELIDQDAPDEVIETMLQDEFSLTDMLDVNLRDPSAEGFDRAKFGETLGYDWGEIERMVKGTEHVAADKFEETVENLLDMEGSGARSRSQTTSLLRNTLQGTTRTQRAILAETLEDFGPDGKDVPLTSETLRMAMFGRRTNETSKPIRRMLDQLNVQLTRGDLGVDSLAVTDDFRDMFTMSLQRKLRRAGVGEDIAEGVSSSIASQISTTFQDNDRVQYLKDILDEEELLDEVVGRATADPRDIVGPMGDVDEADEQLARIYSQTIRATGESLEDVQRQFEMRTDPQTRHAMDRDLDPFGGRDIDMRFMDPKKYEQVESRLDGIGHKIRGVRRNWVAFGAGSFPGIFPAVFNQVDGLSERLGILPTRAQESDKWLRTLGRGMKNLIPSLGAVSANLGPINISLRNMTKAIHGLTALLGPFLILVVGVANALIMAGAALAGFVAVGAIDFLDQMVEGMAGVNDRGEALEKLMGRLKDATIEALQPLRETSIGGVGSAEAFVSTVNHLLALLNQFSTAFGEMLEMPAVAESLGELRAVLFEDLDGSFIEALQDTATNVFPILIDMLVYLIDTFPAFIMFVNDISKAMGDDLGPAFVKLIPLLGLSIKFGAEFLGILANLFTALLTVVDALGLNIETIGGLVGALGVLVGAFAALSIVVELVYLLFYSKLSVALVGITNSIFLYTVGVNAATAATTAFNYAVAVSQVTWQMASLRLSTLAATVWGYVASLGPAIASTWAFIGSLTVLQTALLATGIGALVVGLGLVVAYLLQGGNLFEDLGNIAESVGRGISRFFSNIADEAEAMLDVYKDMMAIAGLAMNPMTLPAFAAEVLTDGKGFDGAVGDMFSGAGPGAPAGQTAGGSAGATINVHVEGASGDAKRLGQQIGREIEKRERRSKRFLGFSI